MFRFRTRLSRYGGGVALAMAGTALAAWLGAALVGASSPVVLAADPPPADDDKKPATDDKPLSFSDEDLEKYRKPLPTIANGAPGAKPAPPVTLAPVPRPAPGATPSTLAPPAAPLRPAAATAPIPAATGSTAAAAAQARPRPPAPDPLKPWKDREELETFREDQLRTLRARISGLESRLEYLNLKRLSILDPTRIMPKPQSEDDRTADKGKGSRDLLASVDREIETAESDLTQAKADLITIETRFAMESGRP
jgi:hypothetical protein